MPMNIVIQEQRKLLGLYHISKILATRIMSANKIEAETHHSTLSLLLLKPIKYSLQGTTQGRYLTGGVPPVRFSM